MPSTLALLRNPPSPPPHQPLFHFLLPPTTSLFPPFQSQAMGSFSSSSSPSPSTSTTPSTKHHQKHQQQNLDENKLSHVLKYHNQTKHSFNRYSRGPHGLDWANQPNPFRRYLSSPLLPLHHFPNHDDDDAPLYSSLFLSLPSPKPISKTTISKFLYDSLSLSAWKTTGFSTWSLRVNPSSGNLHPTEAYVVSPSIESLSDTPFVAHYAPKEHSLELRAQIPSGFLRKFFPLNSFIVGLSSIFWREAWKYGERAFRYCNHDVGHAVGAVAMAAAGLGWDVKVLDGLGFEELKCLMGFHVFPEFEAPSRAVKGKIPEIEFEHPDCVMLVYPSGSSGFDLDYKQLSDAILEFPKLEWKGKPNLLSKEHVCWDIIYRTAEVVKKPLTLGDRFLIDQFQRSGSYSEGSYKGYSVRQVVRKRRSAVDMDGVTGIERDQNSEPSLQNFAVPGKARSKRKRLSAPRSTKDPLSIWSHHLNPQNEALISDPPLLKQAYWLADSELFVPKQLKKDEQGVTKDGEVMVQKGIVRKESFGDSDEAEGSNGQHPVPRRCTHCLAQRTPQWRAGPLGPKTLCNACGVRYKSGRLLPEYRPAKSPTFVSYLHSNSHKKVMEMRMAVLSSIPSEH